MVILGVVSTNVRQMTLLRGGGGVAHEPFRCERASDAVTVVDVLSEGLNERKPNKSCVEQQKHTTTSGDIPRTANTQVRGGAIGRVLASCSDAIPKTVRFVAHV